MVSDIWLFCSICNACCLRMSSSSARKLVPSAIENLISHGLDPQISCAIIENGTRPEQRVFQGKLNQLSQLAEQAQSPALIVVGSVTELHSKLHWFENTL